MTTRLWMKRTKWLTQALIFSGAINIGLIATFIYFALKEKNSVSFELEPLQAEPLPPLTNQDVLRAFSQSSFSDLLLQLEDKELVEEGYTKRDCALACLSAFHHFNLERALGGLVLQQRRLSFANQEGNETIDIPIYPGLADYQYQAIIHYAHTEKWPFTSQGLFFELKRASSPRDPSLLEAFFLTPEFHALSTLFSRSGAFVERGRLIDLVVEGEWRPLFELYQQQKAAQDLNPSRRRALLFSYLNMGSRIAARLLVETDGEFAVKKLNDEQVAFLLNSLKEKTPQAEQFAKDLLASPRCDAIWSKATALLTSWGIAPTPSLPQPQPQPKSEQPQGGIHIVQEGDSLWKIARKYKVSIDELMRINQLESERLRPGKQLKIPKVDQRPRDAKGGISQGA